jgi:5-methyltetrahydrofolate--homocysteine methyltransferase
VLVGGAAINRRFGRRILYTEDDSPYEPGVFYCKDAFEGLETMGQLIDPQRKPALMEQIRKEAEMELGHAEKSGENRTTGQRSAIIPRPIRLPPGLTFGPKVVRSMPLELIFQQLNVNELYRLSWGAKNTHGTEWDKLKKEFDTRLEKMKFAAMKEGWLKPQAVYGFFPCQSDGDDLIIYSPEGAGMREITRFMFPRQPYDEHLCLADYFAPLHSGQRDVVAFQVVTVGQAATERFDEFQAESNYSEGYFMHGLAVQTAEATAEVLHQHIRRELGIPEGQGKRYSWGYPAVPELEDHRKVFDLLPAEKELGMTLTTAYQLVPEQSTAAIIVHHPQARYYTTGESRVDQLTKQRK